MVRQKVTSLHIIPILISLGGGAMPFCQALANEKCPKAIYEAAESSLINARTDWASLFKHQQNFARCDDGGLGEDYSDAVVGLFARKWDQLGFFATLSKKNQSFQIGHLGILMLLLQTRILKILCSILALVLLIQKTKLCVGRFANGLNRH